MKRIVLLLLCGALCATTYSQDKVETRYSVSGGLLGAVNLTKFRTSNDDALNVDYERKAGWSAGAWVNFPVSGGFSIEPQLMYSSYRYATNNTNSLLLANGKINYISLPVLLKFDLGKVFAITAGPQVDFLSSFDDDSAHAVRADFNRTSLSLFGGVELFPHARVSVFGRYIHGLSNMDERSVHVNNLEYRNSNIQLGLKLRLFGSKSTETYKAAPVTVADTDADGILDDVDKCPNTPGLAKYDGCPIPDSDNDGINDEMDKCPNQAGVAKYDGCPIPDSDGDGINDEEDKCPNQAGPANRNGCPVTDSDNDGISDEEDKCPDIAGIAANNGCPEVPANVSKTLGMAGQNIRFGTGSNNAKLTTASNASLDQVVRIMNDNPGMKLRIEGHTDNTAAEDAAMKLSTDRATAVKTYLVGKGISEDRIVVEGLGGTAPISDNSTSSGRMKNNRIELRIVY